MEGKGLHQNPNIRLHSVSTNSIGPFSYATVQWTVSTACSASRAPTKEFHNAIEDYLGPFQQ